MKKYWHAFFMAWGMFSSIPCPYRPWNDDARPLMLLFFPIIGLILGSVWMLAGMAAELLRLPHLLAAAIMTILPYALTGFLHLDGYMDVSDAILSRRGLEDRQHILKDPHVGSFAVIMVCCLFLIHFCVFSSADSLSFKILPLLCASVRACAGVAVIVLRPMKTSQYSGSYRTNVRGSHIIVFAFLFAAALAGGWFLAGGKGVLALLAGAIVYWIAILPASRNLGGMNGDISGFGLVLGELAGVTAIVLTGG